MLTAVLIPPQPSPLLLLLLLTFRSRLPFFPSPCGALLHPALTTTTATFVKTKEQTETKPILRAATALVSAMARRRGLCVIAPNSGGYDNSGAEAVATATVGNLTIESHLASTTMTTMTTKTATIELAQACRSDGSAVTRGLW